MSQRVERAGGASETVGGRSRVTELPCSFGFKFVFLELISSKA